MLYIPFVDKIRKMKIMKKLIFGAIVIFIISIFFASCSTSKKLVSTSDDEIAKIKKKYAPDSRVAVFDVALVKKGKTYILKGETDNPKAKEEVVSFLSSKHIEYIDSMVVLPQSKLGDKIYGVVRLSVCNMRKEPRHSSELLTQATLGTPVKVLKKHKSWYYIQTPDRYLGWVDNAGITLMNVKQRKKMLKEAKLIYTDVYGTIFSEPADTAMPVADIVQGGIVKLVGLTIDKKYWIVSLPGLESRTAYIEKDKAMPLKKFYKHEADYNGDDIIHSAVKLLGIPYLWGGTSTKMMDCSGFTKTVFFRHGIVLPRDASQQVKVGKKITLNWDLSLLEKGDLLFFGKKREDGSERITHVAIYMGEGKIIHATGEVKIQSLRREDPDFAENRLKTLLQARRIAGFTGQYGIKTIKDTYDY